MKTYTVAENTQEGEAYSIEADGYRHNAEADLIEFIVDGEVTFAIPRHMLKTITVKQLVPAGI